MTENKKVEKKKRAKHYESKISFDGTFEQMIALSVKGADESVKKRLADKNNKNGGKNI